MYLQDESTRQRTLQDSSLVGKGLSKQKGQEQRQEFSSEHWSSCSSVKRLDKTTDTQYPCVPRLFRAFDFIAPDSDVYRLQYSIPTTLLWFYLLDHAWI